MRKILAPVLIAVFAIISFNSCKKATVDAETQTAEDNAVAESGFSRVTPAVSAFGIKEEGVNKTAAGFSCATVSTTGDTLMPPSSLNPITMIIDYGAGCVDEDGHTRSGKILAIFTDTFDHVGSTIDIDLVDYVEDNIGYDGDLTLTNNGSNSYTTSVDNGVVTVSDGTINFSGDKTIKWLSGFATEDNPNDDIFEVTGTSSGTSRKGRNYTTTIVKPLLKDMSCKWIKEGTFELAPEGLGKRSVDFGDGTCDGNITVTINGNQFPITLK